MGNIHPWLKMVVYPQETTTGWLCSHRANRWTWPPAAASDRESTASPDRPARSGGSGPPGASAPVPSALAPRSPPGLPSGLVAFVWGEAAGLGWETEASAWRWGRAGWRRSWAQCSASDRTESEKPLRTYFLTKSQNKTIRRNYPVIITPYNYKSWTVSEQ